MTRRPNHREPSRLTRQVRIQAAEDRRIEELMAENGFTCFSDFARYQLLRPIPKRDLILVGEGDE